MGIKEIHGQKILYIIDHATCFCPATIVGSKHKEEIAGAICQHWIALFGSQNEILTDNGGEFNNKLVREKSNHLNIFIKCTAAQSPRLNDITERDTAVLGKKIRKLLLDKSYDYSIDIIVAWTVSAKNVLHKCYGYSSNQLVLGKITYKISIHSDSQSSCSRWTGIERINCQSRKVALSPSKKIVLFASLKALVK